MKRLFLIKTDDFSYDDFDGFVICAEDKVEAQLFLEEKLRKSYAGGDFTNSLFISIGIAHKHIKKGIVLESFNAG